VVAAEERAVKADTPAISTASFASGGLWLARIGEIGLVLTAGILIGRAWRQ
jgi:hypothetical protein